MTYFWKGEPAAVEFATGYLVEQSLSIDNLFVFIMLFEYFKVPLQYQNRVLTWGIIGAIIMRGIMIVVGVAAIERFKAISLIFAAILVVSAFKLLKDSGDDGEEDLSKNFILKMSKFIIKSSPNYDGDRFFTRENGVNLATPLLMCLVCIEISDVVFAIDSIPAVLGVSHDPFVVYTSNIFAIMGLRSLYTIVSKAMKHMSYLKPAVAIVLGFVGSKMVLEYFSYKIGNEISLLVVSIMIVLAIRYPYEYGYQSTKYLIKYNRNGRSHNLTTRKPRA